MQVQKHLHLQLLYLSITTTSDFGPRSLLSPVVAKESTKPSTTLLHEPSSAYKKNLGFGLL